MVRVTVDIPSEMLKRFKDQNINDVVLDALEFWYRLGKTLDAVAKKTRARKKRITFTLDWRLAKLLDDFGISVGELLKALLTNYYLTRAQLSFGGTSITSHREMTRDEKIQLLLDSMAELAKTLGFDEFVEKSQPIVQQLNEQYGFEIDMEYLRGYWEINRQQ